MVEPFAVQCTKQQRRKALPPPPPLFLLPRLSFSASLQAVIRPSLRGFPVRVENVFVIRGFHGSIQPWCCGACVVP